VSGHQLRSIIADMESAMRELDSAGEGVPYRVGGFRNVRGQVARKVARLVVNLEESGSLFGGDLNESLELLWRL